MLGGLIDCANGLCESNFDLEIYLSDISEDNNDYNVHCHVCFFSVVDCFPFSLSFLCMGQAA